MDMGGRRRRGRRGRGENALEDLPCEFWIVGVVQQSFGEFGCLIHRLCIWKTQFLIFFVFAADKRNEVFFVGNNILFQITAFLFK